MEFKDYLAIGFIAAIIVLCAYIGKISQENNDGLKFDTDPSGYCHMRYDEQAERAIPGKCLKYFR